MCGFRFGRVEWPGDCRQGDAVRAAPNTRTQVCNSYIFDGAFFSDRAVSSAISQTSVAISAPSIGGPTGTPLDSYIFAMAAIVAVLQGVHDESYNILDTFRRGALAGGRRDVCIGAASRCAKHVTDDDAEHHKERNNEHGTEYSADGRTTQGR